MTVKLYLTGATGYIGGDALFAINEAHTDFELSLLVRNNGQAKEIAKDYPKARFVYGTLDSTDLLEKEAAAADIVVHTADSADHVPSAQAIAKGLAAGHTAENPGIWLHVSGTGLLMWFDELHARIGEPPAPGESYDDVADIDRIVTLPDQAFHRPVDKVVLAAAVANPGVKTAIVGPPTIYGPGRGPVNRRSRQVYNMAKWTLQRGFAPVIGAGRTEWDNVHVRDVSGLLVRLVDAALDPARRDDERLFGSRTYYFCETGTPHLWSDVARWIAEEAHRQGYLAEAATKRVDPQEVPDRSWGHNSKSMASRARTLLAWKPTARPLKEEIPDVVAGEAKSLGLQTRQ